MLKWISWFVINKCLITQTYAKYPIPIQIELLFTILIWVNKIKRKIKGFFLKKNRRLDCWDSRRWWNLSGSSAHLIKCYENKRIFVKWCPTWPDRNVLVKTKKSVKSFLHQDTKIIVPIWFPYSFPCMSISMQMHLYWK